MEETSSSTAVQRGRRRGLVVDWWRSSGGRRRKHKEGFADELRGAAAAGTNFDEASLVMSTCEEKEKEENEGMCRSLLGFCSSRHLESKTPLKAMVRP
ncbi:hypothetical protein Sjap_018172 [Stephania japonica]|uniref:Uncharacterized protein n=1 Tax=Stephania japonica TaxID=461633 RepID=A0AAP0I7K5_9MAGN